MHRAIVRTLTALLLTAALAACAPGGGGFEPTAVLVAHPYPVVLDPEGDEQDHALITVTNIGTAPTGPLTRTFDFAFDGGPPGGGFGLSAGCQAESLDPGESCTVDIHVAGHGPPPPYEMTVKVEGEDSGSITIPVLWL